MIQVFTVVGQVALASILEIYHGYGFDSRFIPNYLMTYGVILSVLYLFNCLLLDQVQDICLEFYSLQSMVMRKKNS